ncbi:YrdB family protein [Pseudonocardia sp. CA-107938]|uniref:YrdB family protein n=1 Tax=Pseudonocardia sp. CA-107938 TaxID=3240021 RepID=UPI003D8A65AD
MKPVNDGLFFLCELAALVALGIWGWRVGSGWSSWLLVVAAPLAMAVAWGFLAAPTSTTRLADPALLIFQLVVLVGAAVAWWSVGGGWWASALGVVAAVVVVADRLLA